MRNYAEQILGHYFSHAVGRFGDSDTQAEAAEAVADIIKRAVAEANTCLEARVAALEEQNKDLQARLAAMEIYAYDDEFGADTEDEEE
ncbi:MAG: hypothetical protein IPM39_14885 [Chloroflexi bacterium]|nr:hypothetical protein [Chloroflexota bacterium]